MHNMKLMDGEEQNFPILEQVKDSNRWNCLWDEHWLAMNFQIPKDLVNVCWSMNSLFVTSTWLDSLWHTKQKDKPNTENSHSSHINQIPPKSYESHEIPLASRVQSEKKKTKKKFTAAEPVKISENYEIHPRYSHAKTFSFLFSPARSFQLGNCSDHVSFITRTSADESCGLFLALFRARRREKILRNKKIPWKFFPQINLKWVWRRSLKAQNVKPNR